MKGREVSTKITNLELNNNETGKLVTIKPDRLEEM